MTEVDFEHSLCGSNKQTVQSPGITCVTQFEAVIFAWRIWNVRAAEKGQMNIYGSCEDSCCRKTNLTSL